MSIVLIFGTRPDAIKQGPVAAALRARHIRPLILSTGQHTDLLAGTPAEGDLRDAISLGIASDGNVPKWMSMAEGAIQGYLATLLDPPVVVVQGDTMTALAGAQAAANLGLPIAHVEAGVRSHDVEDPWPEELNRRQITTLADWHYAASTTAYANLLAEGVAQNAIRLTGNPGVSALARYTDARPIRPPEPHVLITLHRRELLRRPDDLASILSGLIAAASQWPQLKFFWPVHPGILGHLPSSALGPDNIVLGTPLPYRKLALFLAAATGVITDSGGVQEEAATLGVPCICLRKVTDRPESIEAGVAMRLDPNAAGMAQGVEMLARGRLERRPIDVYGDILAADNIARHLGGLV